MAMLDASIDLEMQWDPDDAAFSTFQSAFFGRSAIAVLILDEADGQGLDADMVVTAFTRNEPLEGVLTVTVTLKPTRSSRTPAWVDSSSSSSSSGS